MCLSRMQAVKFRVYCLQTYFKPPLWGVIILHKLSLPLEYRLDTFSGVWSTMYLRMKAEFSSTGMEKTPLTDSKNGQSASGLFSSSNTYNKKWEKAFSIRQTRNVTWAFLAKGLLYSLAPSEKLNFFSPAGSSSPLALAFGVLLLRVDDGGGTEQQLRKMDRSEPVVVQLRKMQRDEFFETLFFFFFPSFYRNSFHIQKNNRLWNEKEKEAFLLNSLGGCYRLAALSSFFGQIAIIIFPPPFVRNDSCLKQEVPSPFLSQLTSHCHFWLLFSRLWTS